MCGGVKKVPGREIIVILIEAHYDALLMRQPHPQLSIKHKKRPRWADWEQSHELYSWNISHIIDAIFKYIQRYNDDDNNHHTHKDWSGEWETGIQFITFIA